MSCTDIAYAVRCPVLTWRMRLPGTMSAPCQVPRRRYPPGTCLRPRDGMPGTDVEYRATTLLRAHCAMPGTDIAYVAKDMIVSGVDPELARKAYVVPCNMCQNARFLEPPTCNMPICTLPGAIS
eukprot:834904-Rhodomonas_salina.3